MAAFRSNCSRRVLGGVLILGSFVFLGASFASSGSYTPGVFDTAASVPMMGLRVAPDLMSSEMAPRKSRILNRLEEWVLVHRAVSVSV